MKIAFTMKGINLSGQEQVFQKPWFITFIMFFAMALSLVFDKSMYSKSNGMYESLIDEAPNGEPKMSWSKKVKMVSIPAVFDILATGLCSMGFLYIPASVWQLLRGAEMVFAALFAVIFLRRKLLAFHWLGVALCVSGIILVGLASVWGSGGGSDDGKGQDAKLLLLGMGLALGGQVVQAAQVIAEEWLLKEVDLPGLTIVGFEGVWGGLIMLFFAFPLLYFVPGDDNGHLEDELDSFAMLRSSVPLAAMILVYTFSCATYNMAGIAVTGALSAVHRVMLEAFRTSIVWIFGLTVHYCFDPASPFGEAWTPYSWMEVVGFFVLMLGQAVYGEMIHVPGLKYPEGLAKPEAMASPGALKNLASPLPPERTS
eukprot:CAMPEP_0115252682 /NCGR_PEP_ID=MMETSP0270-20121206/44270_1 /TAXON_ID=71861 /ORGANISM="Scrippsiella trochoidea, Strain CCMP3099" /LENGTH=369 /DNA_ID=CAMNT_0002668139 /DNA_START=168 /DNA_END=1277 /DNA_ORIENTATION=-